MDLQCKIDPSGSIFFGYTLFDKYVKEKYMYIVSGQYGIGSDIVNACIDFTDVDLITDNNYLVTDIQRLPLMNYEDIKVNVTTDYLKIINELDGKYKSLETFLEQRKIEHKTKIHKYIFVDCSSERAFEWVKGRLEVLGSLPDLISIRHARNFAIIQKHFADITITLEDVLEGKMIEQLSPFMPEIELDNRLYQAWLSLVKYDNPF
jgi:hypothetical protein